MKVLCLLGALVSVGGLAALELNQLELQHVQKKTDGLYFNGSACATVPGGEKINAGTKEGLTVLLTIKPEDGKKIDPAKDPIGKDPTCMDTYIFKGGEFFFGRRGDSLYSVVYDAKGTFGHTLSGQGVIPPTGKWSQVAVVYSNETQGKKMAFSTTIYLNGEKVGYRLISGKIPLANNKPVTLGQGWGGPWFYRGTINSIRIEPKAMTAAEVSAAAQTDSMLKSSPTDK